MPKFLFIYRQSTAPKSHPSPENESLGSPACLMKGNEK
jgi:hypothetical protein